MRANPPLPPQQPRDNICVRERMCTHACVFVDAGVTLAFTEANGRAHYHHNNPNSTVNMWSAGAMIALFNILAGAEKTNNPVS